MYRFSENKLAIMFITTNSSNTIISKLNELGIQLESLVIGDQESIYKVDEKHLEKIHNIVRFTIRGKNEQLKEYKKLVKQNKVKNLNKSNVTLLL